MTDPSVRIEPNAVPAEIKRWNWGTFLLNWIWDFLPLGDVQPGAVGGGKFRFVLRPQRRLQQQRQISAS